MKNLKTILILAVFAAAFASFLAVNPPVVEATPPLPSVEALTPVPSVQELLNQIAALQQQIKSLQEQIAIIQGSGGKWCHTFNRNLKYGNSGKEVRELQTALKKQGFSIAQNEDKLNRFGMSTASAVVGFQQKYAKEVLAPWGLKYGTGFVGGTTRKKLNQLYGCGTTTGQIIIYKTEWDDARMLGKLYRSDNNGKTWKKIMDQYKGKIIYATDSKNPKIIYAGDTGGNMMGEGLDIDLVKSYNGGNSWIDISKGIIDEQCEQLCRQVLHGTKKSITGISSIWVNPDNSDIVKVTVETLGESVTFKSFNGGSIWSRIIEQPYIKVLSPNGGEKWEIGKTYRIKWDSRNVDKVAITLTDHGHIGVGSGGSMTVTLPVSASAGYYDWTVPSENGLPRNDDGTRTSVDKYKINIREVWSTPGPSPGSQSFTYGVKDSSDNYFSIVEKTEQPYIKVLSPNGGEKWKVGETHQIKWTGLNIPSNGGVTISIHGTSVDHNYYIFNEIDNSGTINWTIPNEIAPDSYKMRIACGEKGTDRYCSPDGTITSNPNAEDYSDNYFSIVKKDQEISCTDSDGNGIDYYTKGTVKSGDTEVTDYCIDNNKLEEYYCPWDGSNYRRTDYTCPNGCEDGACKSRGPYIKVLSPNGGEKLEIGKTYKIAWKAPDVNVKVDIILAKRSPSASVNYHIGSDEHNVGVYTWKVPEKIGDGDILFDKDAKYKIQLYIHFKEFDTAFSDESDNYFSIVKKDETAGWKTYRNDEYGFEFKYPQDWNYGPNILKGESNMVFCPPELSNTDSELKCQWESKDRHMPNSSAPIGLFIWRAEDFPGKTNEKGVWQGSKRNYVYELSLFKESFRSVYNEMLSTFKFIKTEQPYIKVLSPNGGEKWEVGETHRITWDSKAVEKVMLYIYIPDLPDTDIGSGSTNSISGIIPNTGYYDWTIKGNLPFSSSLPRNHNYKIRVDDMDKGFNPVITIQDSSDNYFTIVAAVSGDNWCQGMDLDKSGRVDFLDAGIVRKNLGECSSNDVCLGDIDGNRVVDSNDSDIITNYLFKSGCYGPTASGNNWCGGADINRDGKVNNDDLSAVLNDWGKSCSTDNNWCDNVDTDKDGKIDSVDLNKVNANWGSDCSGSISLKLMEKQLASASVSISNLINSFKSLFGR